MQPLTADPRGHLTDTQVRDLLTAPALSVAAGLELLNTSNVVTADISDDLAGGSVAHDGTAAVHGTCTLQIQRPLAWGVDRVRPFMTLDDGTTQARFNLGVYVLTTPTTSRGEDPTTYDVTGYDLLHLLQDTPGDTYVVTAGTTYDQAVRDAVDASGIGAPLLLDGTWQDQTLPTAMVWALTEEPASWLRIINDLLFAIGYRGLWADENGTLRSEPYGNPAGRAVEWVFNTSDQHTNLVGEDRTVTEDVWGRPNWWRFVRRGMATAPTEGDGLYTVENIDQGPSSQAFLGGRVVRRVVYLDAPTQGFLEAQGDRIVAEDTAVTRTLTLAVEPLPIAGHLDVVQVLDDGTDDKAQVISWELPLDGSPGQWVLEVV